MNNAGSKTPAEMPAKDASKNASTADTQTTPRVEAGRRAVGSRTRRPVEPKEVATESDEVNAIFSKLRDFVGLNDSVEYEYEYDEVSNDDYRDLYQEEQQQPQSPQTAPEPAEPGRRRSRLSSGVGAQASSGLAVGVASGTTEVGVRSTGNSTMSNVIGMPGVANGVSEVVVMEPRSFEEMPQAIQALRERKSVVLNLTMMDPDQAQRSVDFIAGGTYALDGHQERIGESIFLFTPNCVQVSTQSGLVHEVLQAQSRATRTAPTAWNADRFPQVAVQ